MPFLLSARLGLLCLERLPASLGELTDTLQEPRDGVGNSGACGLCPQRASPRSVALAFSELACRGVALVFFKRLRTSSGSLCLLSLVPAEGVVWSFGLAQQATRLLRVSAGLTTQGGVEELAGLDQQPRFLHRRDLPQRPRELRASRQRWSCVPALLRACVHRFCGPSVAHTACLVPELLPCVVALALEGLEIELWQERLHGLGLEHLGLGPWRILPQY